MLRLSKDVKNAQQDGVNPWAENHANAEGEFTLDRAAGRGSMPRRCKGRVGLIAGRAPLAKPYKLSRGIRVRDFPSSIPASIATSRIPIDGEALSSASLSLTIFKGTETNSGILNSYQRSHSSRSDV